jgi:hypothetical protein
VVVITGEKFNNLVSITQGLSESDAVVTVGIKNRNAESGAGIESIY